MKEGKANVGRMTSIPTRCTQTSRKVSGKAGRKRGEHHRQLGLLKFSHGVQLHVAEIHALRSCMAIISTVRRAGTERAEEEHTEKEEGKIVPTYK
jgi:hypothetical protein